MSISKRDANGDLSVSAATIIQAFGAVAIIGLVTITWQDHAEIVSYKIEIENMRNQMTEFYRRAEKLEDAVRPFHNPQ